YAGGSMIEAWTAGASPRDARIDIQVIAPNTSGHYVLDLPIGLLATSRHPRIPNKFIHATSHCLTTHVVDTILDLRCKSELQYTQMLALVRGPKCWMRRLASHPLPAGTPDAPHRPPPSPTSGR